MVIAHKCDIPIMVHTSARVRFALPILCVPARQKYPDRKAIRACAEFAALSSVAQVAASVCGNLDLEIYWRTAEDICWMISTSRPDRVTMDSDLLNNAPIEIARHRALDSAAETYEKVLDGTAVYLSV